MLFYYSLELSYDYSEMSTSRIVKCSKSVILKHILKRTV